jgi:hypothetical protein
MVRRPSAIRRRGAFTVNGTLVRLFQELIESAKNRDFGYYVITATDKRVENCATHFIYTNDAPKKKKRGGRLLIFLGGAQGEDSGSATNFVC